VSKDSRSPLSRKFSKAHKQDSEAGTYWGKASRRLSLNRTQGLGFFVFAWSALLVILAVAPGVYSQALRLPSGDGGLWALAYLVGLLIFLLVLGMRCSKPSSAWCNSPSGWQCWLSAGWGLGKLL
jgi:hypothetical protein